MVGAIGERLDAGAGVMGAREAHNAREWLNFAQPVAEFKGLLGVLIGVDDADVQGVLVFIFQGVRGVDDLKLENKGVQQLTNLIY